MHQVLMNLCLNARDAMSENGTLTLGAENVTLNEADVARLEGVRPGKYVCIKVTDTGAGIPPENMNKLFQPFFSTKAPGSGTGLGLSTCQGIIKKHDGFIAVHSQIQSGTEFRVYLPAADAKPGDAAADHPAAPFAGNGEHILIVDDEEGILGMVRTVLENYGYLVSTASSGLEAVRQFRENPDAIKLVITDYSLPVMGGKAIITALRGIRPGIKVVVTSGSEEEMWESLKNSRINGFIPKPFSTEELLRIAHDVLNETA
jgi:CheY-like chemotaxis protein